MKTFILAALMAVPATAQEFQAESLAVIALLDASRREMRTIGISNQKDVLHLTAAPEGAAVEPPADPARVELSIRVLRDPSASESQKLDAMHTFLDASNLTDDAFWTLLDAARDRVNNTDLVRTRALFSLATAIAYTHPNDFNRGKNLISLILDDRFKRAFDDLGADPVATVRQQRLYFFGATAINTHPAMVKRLVPVFLPMLLSSLGPIEEWFVKSEGLWSLGQLLEIQAISIGQVAEILKKISESDPDISIQESAKELLASTHGQITDGLKSENLRRLQR